MRYVENGVRGDFGKLTLKGLSVPLCRLDEEEYLEIVFGRKSSENRRSVRAREGTAVIVIDGQPVSDEGSIDILELSARAGHCLQRARITTISQLCAMTEEELFRIRNMGKKTVEEVKDKLSKIGYGLRKAEN